MFELMVAASRTDSNWSLVESSVCVSIFNRDCSLCWDPLKDSAVPVKFFNFRASS